MSTARSDADDFVIAVEGRSLWVRVRRHAAARRYRLRYDGIAGELRLTLPPRQRIGPARAWVSAQDEWIARQIALSRGPMAVQPGATLPWDGGEILLRWRADWPRRPMLAEGELRVGGPGEMVGGRLRRWLVERARADFLTRSQAMANGAGLCLAGVSVGDPRGRWGSCTATGRIRYSWRLALAPEYVRHALTAHEVAHLAHMNHGPAFRALERDLGGDAVALSRGWLKAHGATLHALRFD